MPPGTSANIFEFPASLKRLRCRVTCLDCQKNTCRYEMQNKLAELNPEAAVRAAAIAAEQSTMAAWNRALRVGTAADARKTSLKVLAVTACRNVLAMSRLDCL